VIKLTIDSKQVEVPEGTTVLHAAEQAGIFIPTLCDHPELTPYGGCRLCVVELEGARGPVTSCTMPASSGMVVRTDTPKLHEIRKFVLMLLFSERNHYCMYCQKSGGDCLLQNAAYGEGMTHWPIQPNWQTFVVDSSHPNFVLDNNRCILCRRCVRACGELVGNFTLGMHERGASTMLVADYDVPLGQSSCISCGVCVQSCPTGALIDRASAYHGLDQKVEKTSSTCVACSVGCGVELMTRDSWLLRVDGNWDAPANDGLLCQVGRYQALEDKRERLVTPLVRKNGALKAATWDEALNTIAAKVKPLAGDGVAALASPRLPAEALYAFRQIFADKLGGRMVTSLEENATLAGPGAVAAEMGGPFEAKLTDLKKSDCVVLVGTDLNDDHQVAGFFIKRALSMGTQLITLGADQFSDLAHFALTPKAGTEGEVLLGLAATVAKQGLAKGPAADELAKISLEAVSAKTAVPVEMLEAVAKVIGAAQRPVLVYGKGLTTQSVAVFRNLATLARLTGAGLLGVKGEANSLAAFAYGLDQVFDAKDCQAVYLALGDGVVSQKLLASLEKVPFKAVQASYMSPATAMADVVLPVEMWAEQEGHYLSLEGRLQATRRGVKPPEDVRSNAETLAAVAQKLGFTLGVDWKAGLQQRVLTTTILE
jgi:formate dehydrogenase major subunit